MKKIESFEDALQKTGYPVVDFSNVPEKLRTYQERQYQAAVITEAINDGWVADYNNPNQKKWFPVFVVDPSSPWGFAFGFASYYYSLAHAGDASRLCFKSEADAIYAGKTFIEVYAGIISK